MSDPVPQISPLGQRWQTADPFLFCVHHIDHYPRGNAQLGPGFPQHPHRASRP